MFEFQRFIDLNQKTRKFEMVRKGEVSGGAWLLASLAAWGAVWAIAAAIAGMRGLETLPDVHDAARAVALAEGLGFEVEWLMPFGIAISAAKLERENGDPAVRDLMKLPSGFLRSLQLLSHREGHVVLKNFVPPRPNSSDFEQLGVRFGPTREWRFGNVLEIEPRENDPKTTVQSFGKVALHFDGMFGLGDSWELPL